MYRCDYYPTPLQYQYRYFYPSPILPATKTIAFPRVHTCGVHSRHNGCSLYNKIGTNYSSPGSEMTLVRDNALKKILPWRTPAEREMLKDISNYGQRISYNGGSAIDIDRLGSFDKLPDLVTGTNIGSSHANRCFTLPGIKVSPDEWRVNNHNLSSMADHAHNAATIMQTEAHGCIQHTKKESLRLELDTNNDISDRLKDIDTWLSNERDEVQFNINQTHELLELKERLEYMIKGIETPLEISHENLMARESRLGVELVRDVVEESILKEIEIFKRNREKLQEEMDHLNLQLSRLRGVRHALEIDIRNKEDARKTDECVKLLTTLSKEIGGSDLIKSITTNSSPATWLLNCQNLIQRSIEERNTAGVMFADISRTILKIADECFNVWYETNASFNTRIDEMIGSKQQLEIQLAKVLQDIDSVNKHISIVQTALDEKVPLLKLAQARLDKRKQRPGIELCRDKVMSALYREIYALKQAIDLLNSKMQELEEVLAQLTTSKNALETSIRNKDITLFIDHEKCLLNMRHNFPISTFKAARFHKKLEKETRRDSLTQDENFRKSRKSHFSELAINFL